MLRMAGLCVPGDCLFVAFIGDRRPPSSGRFFMLSGYFLNVRSSEIASWYGKQLRKLQNGQFAVVVLV